jgi:2-amino-4-hydroxy-6-hydroxymethyldihydropteridine diphosphokinase/dihydropteroate synthase
LGSNMGSRINNLRHAAELLEQRCLRNSQFSIVLENDSILPPNAPLSWDRPFLNMVIKGETDLSPHELLVSLKSIERELGRPKNYERWSPRIIDLDILLWEGVTINTPTLKVPHAELENRPFLCHLLALMGVRPYTQRKFSNCFTRSLVLYPKFVGVVNVTSDSFSDGGNFHDPSSAITQITKLTNDGASIIEMGAQSTRPGASIIGPEEEYASLEPVLDGVKDLMREGAIKISIDTFWPSVIRKLLATYPISWINDVKGDLDDETLRFIAAKGCHFCMMHSLGVPPKKERVLPLEREPEDVIIEWAELTLNRLIKLGFSSDKVVIDPGLGFGKSVHQNIAILRSLDLLKKFGVRMMIGHSRKSFISAFSTESASCRDIETIAISAAIAREADYLRVHNVADHMRFLATYTNFHESYYVHY